MNGYKAKKVVSIAALALCLAFAATFVLAFTACDEENASANSELTPGQKAGFIIGGSYTVNETGLKVYDEPPETMDSEVIETVYVENDAVTNVSEFDENGVATCVYEGEKMYLTLGGGAYKFYPYSYTLAPISTTAETAEIQVSIIYETEPLRKGKYFSNIPGYVEVSSLTGEPIDITSIIRQCMVGIMGIDDDGNLIAFDMSNEVSLSFRQAFASIAVSTDTVKIYNGYAFIMDDYDVLSIELANGDSYSYGFSSLSRGFISILDDDAEEEEIEEDIDTEDDDDLSNISFAA